MQTFDALFVVSLDMLMKKWNCQYFEMVPLIKPYWCFTSFPYFVNIRILFHLVKQVGANDYQTVTIGPLGCEILPTRHSVCYAQHGENISSISSQNEKTTVATVQILQQHKDLNFTWHTVWCILRWAMFGIVIGWLNSSTILCTRKF